MAKEKGQPLGAVLRVEFADSGEIFRESIGTGLPADRIRLPSCGIEENQIVRRGIANDGVIVTPTRLLDSTYCTKSRP